MSHFQDEAARWWRCWVADDPLFESYQSGPGHPERPERVRAVREALAQAPFSSALEYITPRDADPAEISLVHSERYIEAIRRLCLMGGEYIPSMEATVEPLSWRAALRAAGAGITLAEMFLRERSEPEASPSGRPTVEGNRSPFFGFAPVRPPGHHATRERPLGFCLFNNIAILARYLLETSTVSRIAIVDFDVHHGNGTQEAFWEEDRVLFVSLHRRNLYPYGSGSEGEVGGGKGEGFTLNLPLPPLSGDQTYQTAWEEKVKPNIEQYRPDVILVSAGFDAHYKDPLGGMGMTGEGFDFLGRSLREIAFKVGSEGVIVLLEGGYSLEGIKEGVGRFLGGLLEKEGGSRC